MKTNFNNADKQELQILTDKGFTNLSDVTINDTVYNAKGNKTYIKSKRTISEPCYTILFSNGISINLGESQLIDCYRNEQVSSYRLKDKKGKTLHDKNGKLTNKRIKNYKDILYIEPIKDFYKTFRINKPRLIGHKNYMTYKLNDKLKFDSKNLPLSPYYLGALLGDGNISGNNAIRSDNTLGGTPSFTNNITEDSDIMNRILKEAKQIGDILTIQQIKINKNNKNETYDVRITGTNTREKLRQLGLWGTNCYNKFIPTQYLLSSKEDRLQLLRGLMDTDGYFSICKCGNNLKKIAGFGVTSEQLVKDIKFLIYSLGGSTGRICKKQCKYRLNGKQKVLNHYEYRFEIRMPKDISIFNCKRKKEREKSVKLKSKKMNTLDIAIKDIKKCGVRNVTKIKLTDGSDSFIGNDFLKFRV